MQLRDCFEFEKFDTKFGRPVERIRIKGHRIAIEHVIEQFKAGHEPQAIVRDIYPSLTLEEVYATIAYYLLNKAEVEAYMLQGKEIAEAYYQEYLEKEPPEVVKRLKALKNNAEQLQRAAPHNNEADGRSRRP